MKNLYIEKEIKLEIKNPKKVISKLKELGARKIWGGFQRTIRFDTKNSLLEKRGVFLRIRTGEKNVITLKKKVKESKEVFLREELETKVQSPEIMEEIFYKLGFTEKFIMEKYRFNFKYNNVIVSIDELPFGTFMEIEGNPADIQKTVKDINLANTKRILVTYWDLFENYKKGRKISDRNIIFPNKYCSMIMKKNGRV